MAYKHKPASSMGGLLTQITELPKGKLIKTGTYQGPLKTVSGNVHVADTWYHSVGTARVASAGFLKRQITGGGVQYFRVGACNHDG